MNLKSLLTCCLLVATTGIMAQPSGKKIIAPSAPVMLFDNQADTIPYRIPALTQTRGGQLIAVCDYRISKSDVGYSNRKGMFRIDQVMKTSDDGGKTWSASRVIAQGDDNAQTVWRTAFGDPSIVADRNSNEVLMQCVAGKTGYFHSTRSNPQHSVFFRSTDGGKTWDEGTNLTQQIYGLYDNKLADGASAAGIFLTSGRIMQSRHVKVGKYHRLYIAHPLRTPKKNKYATYVIYSDDFGRSWHVLGGASVIPSDAADESKVEELPDGSVWVSCRNQGVGGRKFNIFTYTDAAKAEGSWGQDAIPEAISGKTVNACNGGVLVVPARRNADRKRVFVALQSVPMSRHRENVGFFYRELASKADYASPEALAKEWQRGLQVSNTTSCYSEMILMRDGKVGFIYEEGEHNNGYNIMFRSLSLDEITNGKFSIDRRKARKW